MKFRFSLFGIVLGIVPLMARLAPGNEGPPGARPPLTEQAFRQNAYEDAQSYYPDWITRSVSQCRFTIYQGYAVDLDGDGEDEFVVSGDLQGPQVNIVMAYVWVEEAWQCIVLNRSKGGSIDAFQIIDVDNDGRSEVFSVLQDEDMKRHGRIHTFSGSPGDLFRAMFELDTPGGWNSSYNFCLVQASSKNPYRVRVDEVLYPDNDYSEVQQKTYFYKLVKNQFTLDSETRGGISGGRP